MKLYTEEQLRVLGQYVRGKNVDNLIASLTPMQLPSDEEIRNSLERSLNNYNVNDAAKEVWIDGAKWMKEQILKQDKL